MMYQAPLSDMGSRKRDRESDDEGPQGFSDHRSKRPHIANLPLRHSPELRKQLQAPQRSPSVADITPASSDSEDTPVTSVPPNEPRSFFSPWSSPPAFSDLLNNQVSPSPAFSQSSSLPDAPIYSDDTDMGEPSFLFTHSNNPRFSQNNMLTVGSSQPDTQASSLSGRLPTPIQAQFSSQVRYLPDLGVGSPSLEYNYSYSRNTYHSPDRRRLPSPISEADTASPSPRYNLHTHTRNQSSMSITSDADMGMEVEVTQPLENMSVEPAPEVKLPAKKGHTRSKHSIRGGWGPGYVGEMGGQGMAGLRKGFSMGYRSDCEKCRMKVPGHFSHIISY